MKLQALCYSTPTPCQNSPVIYGMICQAEALKYSSLLEWIHGALVVGHDGLDLCHLNSNNTIATLLSINHIVE